MKIFLSHLQRSLRELLALLILIFMLFPACTPFKNKEAGKNTMAGDQDAFLQTLYPYFPTRMHAFIWRNWESVSLDRMAKVLKTTPENVRSAGLSMGLPEHHKPNPEFKQRGYISLIRRNWNLISYDQMLTLLNWDAKQLDETLRDDDFLWVKVGGMKPVCPPVQYEPPTPSVEKRCAEIKTLVVENFDEELKKGQEKRFAFIGKLSGPDPDYHPASSSANDDQPIRFIYSYFAPFGDPLLNPELDPFPDGLLERLAQQGINGVWLHVVLHQLTASSIFPELGKDHEIRLKNLRKLAQRTSKYGIKIYLYMNEPRAMPLSFFKGREEILGVQEKSFGAMCTSVPLVRQWLKESLTHVFREVPELGGVFTITGSENLTNCWSHQNGNQCPRCSKRSPVDVIAEVNKTIAEGVWEGNPHAKVIVWDWGWPDGTAWGKNRWAANIIEKLPEGVYEMSVSEWSKPVDRGGVKTTVGEYSISVVGPGPRALRLWNIAKEKGLKTIAKIQVNNSWELSAIPYLPVMNLIGQHIKNLQKVNIDGLMLSWSLGGYPSPNLDLVKYIQDHPSATLHQSLKHIAVKRYGEKAAPEVLKAWASFSSAFTEFPYGLSIYTAPMQYGPANPFYLKPTGKSATMLGFPYDDLEKWRGVYPAEILAQQFEKLADKWEKGLPYFEAAAGKTESRSERVHALEDGRLSKVARIQFQSVANQIRFIMARDSLISGSPDKESQAALIKSINKIIGNERELAKQMYKLNKEDSRIGFEASNHYYYLPLDFIEKVINCDYVSKHLTDLNQTP